MNIEAVKKLRELHGDDTLVVFADNAKIFDNSKEHCDMIWDDANEILHVIRTNIDFYNSSKIPMTIDSTTYEFIQYIGSSMDVETFKTKLNSLKADNLITDEQINKIITAHKL